MTIQEAIKKITSSEDFKKKAIEALKNGKGDEFLKEQGIDLTVDQIKEAIRKKELTKSELDMAAGGYGGVLPPGLCDDPLISAMLAGEYGTILSPDICGDPSSINEGAFNCVFKIN